LRLPNIQHLHTLVSAQLPKSLHLLDILAALHPTPAVAGTPQDSAEAYLRHYEPFDRHLYAAPLGWVDYRGNGSFTVGIRSALRCGDRLRLYAGAGIVAESDPHKEWAEVHLKLQTLLQTLVAPEVRAVNS
jgi:menaquinone-specific isochorismate synthase